jgi:hypothetical protein
MTGGNGFDICDLADYFEMHALILSISVIYCWHNDQNQPTLQAVGCILLEQKRQ